MSAQSVFQEGREAVELVLTVRTLDGFRLDPEVYPGNVVAHNVFGLGPE